MGAADDRKTGDESTEAGMQALIEARLSLLAAAYPALVTSESQASIRDEIAATLARDAALRRFRLENGDEPMALFRPYRAAAPEEAE